MSMSMSVGASSSNALSYLEQLLQHGKAKATDASKATDPLSMLMQSLSNDGSASGQAGSTTATSSATSSGSSSPAFGSDTMAALISAQGQQANASAESRFFAKLDSNGDGQISQSEFSAAASKAGADSGVANAVFAKIDGNGDGAVSLSELAKADHGGRHHHRIGGGGAGGAGALNTLLSGAGANGATTQTSTNADGSTTTTITYADGSKIDMTTPATASASSGGDNDGDGDGSGGSSGNSSFSKSASNMLEQLIKLQPQMLSAASSTLSAVA